MTGLSRTSAFVDAVAVCERLGGARAAVQCNCMRSAYINRQTRPFTAWCRCPRQSSPSANIHYCCKLSLFLVLQLDKTADIKLTDLSSTFCTMSV